MFEPFTKANRPESTTHKSITSLSRHSYGNENNYNLFVIMYLSIIKK